MMLLYRSYLIVAKFRVRKSEKKLISLFRRRAIRKYLYKVARFLKQDYGSLDSYNAKQVVSTIERHKLGSKHHVYAMAMFSSLTEFERHFEKSSANQSYEETRQEIADTFFDGNSNFNIPKIVSVGLHVGGSSEGGGDFGGSGAGGDGGGGDGG